MVSFIIVNFNGEKYIERCISSVLALKVEKEIIVVDNGSTDRSRDLINKFNVKKVFLKKKFWLFFRNKQGYKKVKRGYNLPFNTYHFP